MSKKCLISYAKNGREPYEKALRRNEATAKQHTNVELLYYYNELPDGCPTHKETPYGFKPAIFKEAFDQGFTQVIWVDSTIVINRNLDRIFAETSKRGVVAFHNLGHDVNDWISDVAAQKLGLDLDKPIAQIMACVVGFDISTDIGRYIFDEWYEMSQDGESFHDYPSSRPTHKAHRHDQACLSGLLHNASVSLVPYGALCYEPHDQTKEFGETIYFINKGIQ